jgi:DNA repair ATPase RecN
MQMLKTMVLVSVLSAAVAAPAGAQDREAGTQRSRGGRASDPAAEMRVNAADVMKVLDGYAVVQAQEALQLSDTQYGPFVTRLKRLQDTRRRNQQARQRILQELRKLTAPGVAQPDEAAVRQQLQALRDHDGRVADEIRKAYDALDEVLDARQQARFRLFEERLELRKMDLLMRARQGAARRQIR